MPLISLTFDDALDSHLDVAIPLLDHYGIKGTFYVNLSSECLGRRAEEWRGAAAAGHELGNHTIFHPALSSKTWVRAGNEIEAYTLDRMRLELEVANNLLRMLDGETERTFAFPCGFTSLGRSGLPSRLLYAAGAGHNRILHWLRTRHLDFGSSVTDYTPLVEELFFAARCGSLVGDPLPANYHRYHVPSFEGDGKNAGELVAFLDKASKMDTWLVFSFHGVGGGHGLYCETAAFEAFVGHLAADERFSVKTFLDAAKDIWS